MPEAPITVYHNPRCSKSREACSLLEKKKVAFNTVEYLKHPLTKPELAALVGMLGIKAEDLVRKGEAVFKEKYEGKKLTEAGYLDAMAADPVLMERPVIVRKGKAVIGRPPEKVLELLASG